MKNYFLLFICMVINIDLSAMNEMQEINPKSSKQKKQPSSQNQSRKKGPSKLKSESKTPSYNNQNSSHKMDHELLEQIYGLVGKLHESQKDVVSSLKLLEKSNTLLYNSVFKNDENALFSEEGNQPRDPFAPIHSNNTTQKLTTSFTGFDISEFAKKSIEK